MAQDNFSKNVFINCPFDDEYLPVLRSMVFTVAACGYAPHSALQERDAGDVRLKKIQRLIRQCRFGIHDISRTELDAASKLPRFNMPFELGIDIGAKEYGNGRLKTKNILIFDSDKYRYQRFLSDIAGQDISSHGKSASEAIGKIRHWLNANRPIAAQPLIGAATLRKKYDEFQAALPAICDKIALDESDLEFNDLLYITDEWITLNV